MSDAEALEALLHGREPLWPPVERALFELWAATAEPMRETLEASGTPAALRNYVESGADILSPAEFDPYSSPARFVDELSQLVEGGWLEAVGEGQYRVTARARSNVEAAMRAGDAHLETLGVLPAADLERHAALLERVVQAEPAPDAGALTRIRRCTSRLSRRRDDAHRAAWMTLDVPGHVWNAFTLIWHGDARNAIEVAALQSFRGYTASDYATAIEELVRRGWLEPDDVPGRYRASSTGTALRDEVEARTDLYFYRPWSVLTDAEWEELGACESRLRERLRDLRRSARQVASRS